MPFIIRNAAISFKSKVNLGLGRPAAQTVNDRVQGQLKGGLRRIQMTHTLHRRGGPDQPEGRLSMLAIRAKGFNDEGNDGG